MKLFLFAAAAAAAVLAAAASARADDSPRAWVAHDARIKSLEDRVSALESKPARPAAAAAVAATLPPAAVLTAAGVPTAAAPAGMRWEKAGQMDSPAPWLLVGTPAPAFATPVRNALYQFAPRTCAGGNCPR